MRTYDVPSTLQLLLTRTCTHLSVDNDLGGIDHTTEGFNVLNALEEWVFNDHTFPVPVITVHSSNAGRTPSMRQTAARLEAIRQQQIGGS